MTNSTTYTNVTIYTKSDFLGNIIRTDVKEVTVTTGVKYAQYNNAVKVEWKAPRQRRARAIVLTYAPFLVIVPTSEAINPDSAFVPMADQKVTGIELSVGRHSMCSNGWNNDFMTKLAASGATVLADLTKVNTMSAAVAS